ncbi:peptidase M22 [Candidatus Pelagibacter sp.]|nr:peptidase M22 [Candidatus Pelagibacter sp.]|tara:strand:- start:6 stop:398 length:393 start_codon:yes stop_codon:yes gene_type:complete
MKKKTKKNLVIDAASEKIIFKIIDQNKIYTNDYENSRKNFDKFAILLFNFLEKNMISFDFVDKVLINLGPGKYSSIRTSISTFKALNLIYKFEIYGFCSKDVENCDYTKVLDLLKKGKLIKKLIKPLYMS